MRRIMLVVLVVCIFTSFAGPAGAQADTAGGVQKIAFVSWDGDADTYVISTVNPDGSGEGRFVVGRIVWMPSWSPDGTTLAFLGKTSTGARARIYLIDADGGNLRALDLPTPVSLLPDSVTWSPDGAQLIYSVSASGRFRFYRLDLASGEAERIPFAATGTDFYVISRVEQSPDGLHLAVLAQDLDSRFGRLFVTDADGSTGAPFTAETPDGTPYSRLVWSPDGQRVALAVDPGFATDPQPLAVADADGSALDFIVVPPPNYISSVSWSPDGARLAFAAVERGVETMPDGDLFVVDADGGNLRELHVEGDVMALGTSWGTLPAGTVMPSAPVLLETAAK